MVAMVTAVDEPKDSFVNPTTVLKLLGYDVLDII